MILRVRLLGVGQPHPFGYRTRQDVRLHVFDDDDDEYWKVGYASFLRSKAWYWSGGSGTRTAQADQRQLHREQIQRHGTRQTR